MSTKNQSVLLSRPKKKYKRPKFNLSPQRKGVVLRLRICTPRKPNSARRPVAKIMLSTKKKVLAHIPGSGHNLRRFSKTLVKGVGARDVPYVNYTCIHGVYDFMPFFQKKRRRSIYGVPRHNPSTHLRRIFRKLI